MKRSLHLENASSLTESLAINNVIGKIKNKIVFVDSITTMLIHNKQNCLQDSCTVF